MLARSAERLTKWARVHLVGREHRWLRDVGDGWQILETRTFCDDPLDLAAGVAALVADTGAPAMAASVSDDRCAALFAHTPRGRSWSAHLPRPTSNDGDYEHPPGTARGRTVDAVCADVMAWAQEAGFSASAAVRLIVEHDRFAGEWSYGLDASDQIFELFLALGLPRIPPSRHKRIDPLGAPFSLITEFAGLGMTATQAMVRNREALKDGDEPEPIEDWMRRAAELHDDIWDSVLEDHGPITDLIARIKITCAAYIAANPHHEARWVDKQRRRLDETRWADTQRRRLSGDVAQRADLPGIDPDDWRAGRHALGPKYSH